MYLLWQPPEHTRPSRAASADTWFNHACEACADGRRGGWGFLILNNYSPLSNVTRDLSLILLPRILLKPEAGVIDMNVGIYYVLFHYIGQTIAILRQFMYSDSLWIVMIFRNMEKNHKKQPPLPNHPLPRPAAPINHPHQRLVCNRP
ncbi:MAG: hypothetical protein D5R96_06370 [Methanocalculus sp. MSAO_Arc2]|nr:MAG: hypothetical protein D5R96_06370 [Methanocalculus sp. MSAO_Arc2]